jgi:double-strand break repair protein MRE11
MDILAAANLINYFGKSDQVDDIEITPVLIKKNEVYLAIYGLGAIRDERLNRMWNQKNVKFIRPSEEQGKNKFFNIFVLHQNRDYGRGAKSCIHESMIPEWMDLVIWGNEHECIPKLVESLVGTYRIYQPGSSVATSLCAGESLSHPKSFGFIEIRKTREFRLTVIPFCYLRPFKFSEISLSDNRFGLDPNDTKIEEKMKKLISKCINELIIEAREEGKDMICKSENIENNQTSLSSIHHIQRKFTIKNSEKVIIRLRIEHNGFPTINITRLGAPFINDVANIYDIVSFSKQRTKSVTDGRAVEGVKNKRLKSLQNIFKNGEEDEIQKIRIEDLVTNTLQSNNKQLNLLPEMEMSKVGSSFLIIFIFY